MRCGFVQTIAGPPGLKATNPGGRVKHTEVSSRAASLPCDAHPLPTRCNGHDPLIKYARPLPPSLLYLVMREFRTQAKNGARKSIAFFSR